MSSYTVTLDGDSSILHTTIFPPLQLRETKEWEVALLDFTTYNSIPNITEGVNNKFYYYETKDEIGQPNKRKSIQLKTGNYEIDDINTALQKELGKENIKLEANNSLLKAEIISKYFVDFTERDSIGEILGFPTTSAVLTSNQHHTGTNTVNIVRINVINITCNIVSGSFKNGVNQHILHSFYPSVEPGFKIIERPHNLVYLPVNTSHISDIVLCISDQDGILVDFRKEKITIRLHIKTTI